MTASHRTNLRNQTLTANTRPTSRPAGEETIDQMLTSEMPLDQILMGSVSVACFAAISFYVSWPIGLALGAAMVARSIVNRVRTPKTLSQTVWSGVL